MMSASPATIRVGVLTLPSRADVIDPAVGREHVAVLEVGVELAEGPRARVLEGVAIEPRDRPLVDVVVGEVERVDLVHARAAGSRSAAGPAARGWRTGTAPAAPDSPGACRSWGASARMMVLPIATKLAIRSGRRVQLQVGEHQHAAHAVADPVHAIAARLALDVVEDRRDVVAPSGRPRSTIARRARGTGSAAAAG